MSVQKTECKQCSLLLSVESFCNRNRTRHINCLVRFFAIQEMPVHILNGSVEKHCFGEEEQYVRRNSIGIGNRAGCTGDS